ncbi:HSF-type DNA-binding-domain-containing protein, partial [Phycomyces blakesleeanus]
TNPSMSSHSVFNGSSVSSGSPLNSPLASPLSSPYNSPGDLPWDQLQNQFSQQMSLQPPSTQPSKTGSGNTFVHKLFNMVIDKQYQHLIAWTYSGTSFIVCNITEFSRDVLPKHFKHNNFSSFVRQLNMQVLYGFHKVNKSPRGHRTLAENQIWEFSHPKFMRGRPDLLDEIKRKALEAEVVRRDNNGDLNSHMSVLQVTQSDMMQQLVHLQENIAEVVGELAETRKRQEVQQQMMNKLMDYVSKQYGSSMQAPPELSFEQYAIKPEPERPPPIYITSPDANGNGTQMQNMYLLNNHSPNQHHVYHSALNTPLSPSGSHNPFAPDEDVTSVYGSQSPHTPHTVLTTENAFQNNVGYQQSQQIPIIPTDMQLGFNFGFNGHGQT